MNKKNKISGYIMASIGFVMILFNAINYIFGLDGARSIFSVLGIVFVVIGMKTAKSREL